MIKLATSPFGSVTRTRVLLALRLLGSSYPRELARLLDAHVSGVLKALASLDADGDPDDRQSLELAVAIARRHDVALSEIAKWCRAEGGGEVFDEFVRSVRKRPRARRH